VIRECLLAGNLGLWEVALSSCEVGPVARTSGQRPRTPEQLPFDGTKAMNITDSGDA
jgi:hypothetical protein